VTDSIFISYGQADMKTEPWIDRVRLYLAQNRGIEIWDDSKIVPGADWRQSIATALGSCNAAILLVGPAFLGSDFVMSNELPHLLVAARSRRLPIFPLVIKYVAYKRSVLEGIGAVNNPDQPLESLPTAEQNRILNKLAIDVKLIQRQLAITLTAFTAQVRRRDDLVKALEDRLGKELSLEYEKLFFRYYKELTADERFIFDQIRAVTEGALEAGNRKILDLLEAHADLLDEIPLLVDLRQHLVFWLNKFERVFKKTPEMCLLYAGVEDGVPFPGGIDREIDAWLRKHPPRRG
jgi:hypothetical protein